ncbi:OmpA family protein [Salinisphaera hydrothermalis]|uniref:OmpA/MotB domain-containing protein n=1 Tax=Salinisphaera hydrothermalis (strain C41B8) TaxID=1304275 RepID=A0A084IG27_SALHC|nr:OmpA family protein [Salinisphaera hydrothermalis]KEZ75661.1 OmpA/MotB domain-containing protein [Salinisphaera hydrothermalis C41B8]
MNRLLLLCTVAVVLPLFAGCAVFRSNPVPPSPSLTGVAAQNAAWHDEIHRSPTGDTPTFGPLTDAEDAVQAAQTQPQVSQFDSQSLTQAQQALAQAKNDWQAIANKKKRSADALAKVADEAHQAQRLAQIAQYTAQREIGLKQLNQLQAQQQRSMMASSSGGGGRAMSTRDLAGKRVVPDMLGALHFQSGTARLTQDSHPVIGRLAKLAQAHPKLGVAIFGFTDNSAPPAGQLKAFINANPNLKNQHLSHAKQVQAYHQGLSDARARDVAQLLVQAGVDPHRLGARGMGESHPIASNATASGRRKNERAEVVLVPLQKRGG